MTAPFEQLFDRDQIAVFLAIVEAKSFSRAAARLGITQPAISQTVKRLETAIGCKLFCRVARGVVLTHDGEAVLVYARAMRSLTDDLRRQLRRSAAPVTIGIGMSEDFLRTALPKMLGLFARSFPDVGLRCISGTYETLDTAIRTKSVDVCVMRRFRDYANTLPLWTDELKWLGRPHYPVPVSDPVPLVLPIGPNPARELPLAALRDAGRSWIVRFESVGVAGIEFALQAGLGLCDGPGSMKLVGAGPLAGDHGLPDLPDVEFVMVTPTTTATTTIQAALVEMLQHAAKTHFSYEAQAADTR